MQVLVFKLIKKIKKYFENQKINDIMIVEIGISRLKYHYTHFYANI